MFAEAAAEAVKARGVARLAISGGSTPKTMLTMLASTSEPFLKSIPWDKVQLYWVDERCVGPDDPESNYGMTKRAMLGGVPLPWENVHRIEGELDPEVCAAKYEEHLAPIAAIAAAAAHTTTLRVGCRVFCVDYHVPAVLAKEAVTLDLLSDGRLELGIGAGWSGAEYAAMGLTFDTPGRRIAKLKEVVALVKAHCADGEIALSGEFVNVNGYRGTPHPCSVRTRPS